MNEGMCTLQYRGFNHFLYLKTYLYLTSSFYINLVFLIALSLFHRQILNLKLP